MHLSKWSESFILKWIFCNLPTQMYTKKIEEKVPRKVGECIFGSQKCKSFQGQFCNSGGPWTPANIIRLISLARLRFPMSAKSRKKFLGPPPLTKSWIRYWRGNNGNDICYFHMLTCMETKSFLLPSSFPCLVCGHKMSQNLQNWTNIGLV